MKLTDIDKLKYWIDAEFGILHVMFGIIMLQLTEGLIPTMFFGGYIITQVIYTLIRIFYLASQDPNFLRVPKK